MIQGVTAEVETRDAPPRARLYPSIRTVRHKRTWQVSLGWWVQLGIAYLVKRKARRAITRTAGFDGGPVCDQLGDALFSDFDLLVCRKTGQGTRPDYHRRPLGRFDQN